MKTARSNHRRIAKQLLTFFRASGRSIRWFAHFCLIEVLIYSIVFLPLVMQSQATFTDANGDFTIWAEAGRVSHSFAIHEQNSANSPNNFPSAQLYYPGRTTISGNYPSAPNGMVVRDLTTNEVAPLSDDGNGSVTIPPGAWSQADGGGLTYLYFIVDSSRQNHNLAVVHTNGTTYLAGVDQYGISGYFWDSGWIGDPIFTAGALFDPSNPFRVVDLTTNEQCSIGETFTPAGTWEPFTLPPPVREVTLYLDAAEAGNAFTIHSQADGGAEMLQSAMANPVSIWSSFFAADGTYHMADYPFGILNFATLSVVIGEGMTFWVTRDYDGADPQSDTTTRFYLDPTNIPEGPWMLNAQFTPIPMVWREFYIATSLESEPWWSNGLFIYQPGGFSQIVDTDGTVYSTPDVDYLGNDHSFYYRTHHAWVRPNQSYWIAYPNGNVFASSTTNPNDYQWTMLTSNSSENTATGGWTPLNGVAPPGAGNDLLRIFIPESRTGRDIRLYRGHPSDANSIQKEFSMLTPFVDIITNPWNSEQRLANSMMLEGGGPYTAADPLGWFLLDVDANEVKELHSGENDLRDWVRPQESVTVQISLSRWTHVLTMRCEDGSEFPLVNKSWSQGDISTLNGEAYFNPYYFFDASFSARPGLNWFVWDETTQEASPAPTSMFYLGDWIVAPPVEIISLSELGENFIGNHYILVKPVMTQDSALLLERLAPGGQWEHVATSATNVRTPDDSEPFIIPFPINSGTVRFRARSVFGGVYSQYSNEESAAFSPDFSDTDGDGLDDKWELAWGLNPNVADSHLRLYGMETALESFQANAGPPAPGETPTPSAWTATRRVRLWQTPYYDGLSSPQLHPSHYVLTWDLPDPALTGNVQIRVESEEGQWATQSTVAVTDQYVRVEAPARSIDPVKIRKRLVVGEHEEFNYKLIGAVTSNESQVKVRLRTRSRSVFRVNPAIVQLFPSSGNFGGGTDSRFKKAVITSEWNYESDDPSGNSKDKGKNVSTVTANPLTGKITWKQQDSRTYYHLDKYGPSYTDPTDTWIYDEWSTSEEVKTFEVTSPALADPYTRVIPCGVSTYISTKTVGSGKLDPITWSRTETRTKHATGTTADDVNITEYGTKHTLDQATAYNVLDTHIVGTEYKEEWENNSTNGTPAATWTKVTTRNEDGGTVTIDGGTPSATTGVDSINNQTLAHPSFYAGLITYGSTTWGNKINTELSESYSDTEFLSNIALAVPQSIPAPTIWQDRYEDSLSDFQSLWRKNVAYPTYGLAQGGIVSQNRLTSRGLHGEVMKSEYWLECNDCLPGGTAMALETWEFESLYGPLGAPASSGTVRIVTLPIGGKEGQATSSAIFNSEVPAWMRNQSRYVNLSMLKVVDLAPKLKDETGTEIVDSNGPLALPNSNGMIEEHAANNRIAHRELKVSIGAALKDRKVSWSMEAKFTPTGASQPRFRGDWATAAAAHRNRFEVSTTYGANAYRPVSQEQGETTVDAYGFTAIRVNVPPWGLNKARIKIQIEGMTTPIDLIDLEVPGIIVIDPGHGVGPAGSSNEIGGTGVATGAQEHAIALDIGTRMAADLRRRRDADHLPIKVFMTRTGPANELFIDRTRLARENGCDVYISIHFNSVDNVPLRRHPFGMWDLTGNHNLAEDQALARRVRQAVQRAILAVEPAGSRNAPTDEITSETHEANLQKGLDTLSDSTNATTPNYNGNIPGHTPCRATLIEMEWLGNTMADLLFNQGNTTLSETANHMREAAGRAMADAAIEDLYAEPAQ